MFRDSSGNGVPGKDYVHSQRSSSSKLHVSFWRVANLYTTVGVKVCFFFYRLDYNHQVKVSDFGLAEDVYTFRYFQQDANSDFKLPLKWMALESLQLGRFSEKTDVVSFFLQFFDHLYQCHVLYTCI